MIILAVGLVVSTVCAWVLISYGSSGYRSIHGASLFIGVLLGIATAFTGIGYVWSGWSWMAAEQKANIINREYGTNYTQKEVYFASDVIDTVRQLDRKRIEVNGDLMREKEDK